MRQNKKVENKTGLNPDEWMSVSQFARHFEVTPHCVRLAIAQGRVDGVMVGSMWFIPAREILRFKKYAHTKKEREQEA